VSYAVADHVENVFSPSSHAILQPPCRSQAEITYDVLGPCWCYSSLWPAANFQSILVVF